jgi:hypothetical protein
MGDADSGTRPTEPAAADPVSDDEVEHSAGDGEREPKAGDNAGAVIQVALAEFGKLRDEIGGRSTAAWTLVGLSITSSATLAGFVLAQKADARLLLVLPLLTPSLGLLFMDHAANIGRIGDYINTVLKPVLREAACDRRLLSYEEWVDAYEAHTLERLLPFGIPLVLAFTMVPVGALVYLAPRIDEAWSWILWVLGAIVTFVQVWFWYRFLVPPLRRALGGPDDA